MFLTVKLLYTDTVKAPSKQSRFCLLEKLKVARFVDKCLSFSGMQWLVAVFCDTL